MGDEIIQHHVVISQVADDLDVFKGKFSLEGVPIMDENGLVSFILMIWSDEMLSERQFLCRRGGGLIKVL